MHEMGSAASLVFRATVSAESFISGLYANFRALYDVSWRSTLRERACRDLESVPEPERVLWFHAASVGEVNGIAPLVRIFLKESGDLPVLITTTSVTGRDRARAIWGDSVRVRLAPLESVRSYDRFFGKFHPVLLVINETELWPVMIYKVHELKIPAGIVNARISDRAYPRYKKFRMLFAPVLKKISFVFSQSDIDRKRFIELGASPDVTEVRGSTKFDVSPADVSEDSFFSLWKNMAEGGVIFTAGSVREPEEDVIVRTYIRVREKNPAFRMIIAPRHPERYVAVEKKLKEHGIRFLKKSQTADCPSGSDGIPEVILLDTFGDLSAAYSVSDLSFVGGTLCPVGGHNILEPAVYGTPVITGPYTMNVRAAAELLAAEDALLAVQDEEELLQLVLSLCSDRSRLQELSGKSVRAADKAKGATRLIFNRIRAYL
jgi:3-deoxy-D-manno-octulosonic-acid transferase